MEEDHTLTADLRSHLSTTTTRKSHLWDVFGKRVPRSEIVFVCQLLVIYVVISVSLFSLTRGNDPADNQLWSALLSSCLGYLLPNPRIDPPPQQP